MQPLAPRKFTHFHKVHISGLFILATFIDVHAAFLLARDVVCVLPWWVPQVDVDLRPSAGWLRIGARQILLEDIKVWSTCVPRNVCLFVVSGFSIECLCATLEPLSAIEAVLALFVRCRGSRSVTPRLGRNRQPMQQTRAQWHPHLLKVEVSPQARQEGFRGRTHHAGNYLFFTRVFNNVNAFVC